MFSYINIFSVHYFLWFAALTSIYGYYSVYSEEYANASSSQYGLLNMILPFVTILAKLFFCSLADRHRAYRSFFIYFLIASLIGFGSFAILPIFIEPQPKELGLNYTAWILICLMTSTSTISMSVISCLSDAFAMNSTKKGSSSYGIIRLWGTIGWAFSSVMLIFINDTKKLPLLVPGLIMTIVLLLADILAQLFWPYKDDFKLDKSSSDYDFNSELSNEESITGVNISDSNNTTTTSKQQQSTYDYGTTTKTSINQSPTPINNKLDFDKKQLEKISSIKIQWLLFVEVAKRRRSIFRYMVLFTISGALISLQWSYFFLYLKKLYNVDFTFISALSMVGQAVLGELPFFIFSKFFVDLLGRSNTLSFSFVSIGLRYFLYEHLLPNSNMYFVLLTESLQGPSFGLFYVVMTEVGLDYSDCEEAIVKIINEGIVDNRPEHLKKLRQALRATMQSLMSACYEGLGVGIGSIVGGLVIDYYDFDVLWFWSSIIATLLGIGNFLIDHFNLPLLVDKLPN